MKLFQGDCFELIDQVPDASVDMVILDPPHNEWDRLWTIIYDLPRVCPSGFVVSFCRLVDIRLILQAAEASNNGEVRLFDSYVWHDPQPAFVHTSRALRTHEHIIVLAIGKPELPVLTIGEQNKSTEPQVKGKISLGKWTGGNRVYRPAEKKHLTSVLKYSRPLHQEFGKWQKPVELFRVLVQAYCPRGGTILDPFAGSGTTAQVAEEEGRESVLIEINPKYTSAIAERMSRVQPRFNLV